MQNFALWSVCEAMSMKRLKYWIPFWVVPTLLLFSVATIWVRLMIVNLTYSIHEANREISQIQKEKENFQLRLAFLRSPRRLEFLAKTLFQFSQPKLSQLIHFR